ncbi:unnamed protein product, partial [Sphagnum jensenii]
MEQWGMGRPAPQAQQQQPVLSHVPHQQGVQQGVQAQYSYSSSSYASQQVAAPPSAASASYGQPQQAYSQQAYSQQTYVQQQPTAASVQGGYASTATYGAPVAAAQPSAQQQQQVAWSQQASVQGAQQADHSQGTYGRTSTGVTSLPATGGGSVNSTSQYGGQYGAVYPSQSASQQLLGASGRVVTAADDYQAQTVASRGSAAYGGPQDSRATIASGASYVVGGAPSGSVSGVYGASDTSKYGEAPKYAESGKYGDLAKYGDNAKYGGTSSTADYAGKGSDYGVATSPSTFGQKPAADPYGANYGLKSSEYAVPDRGQYAQTQSAYGQADTRDDTARRYQDAHAAAAAAQQRQAQLLRQQQAIQAQLQTSMINRAGAGSPLEGATSRVESELVAQYGGGRSGAGGASAYAGSQQASVYGGIGGGRGLAGQIYGGQPAMGYGGVQLPPGRDYGAGRGAGGGFSAQRDGYARSDRPSIGSSRNDDRREQRPVFHVGDRHYDDSSRRRDPRERGRSNSSRVGVGSGRGGGLGGTGGAGGFEREERDRVRDRDRERREDDRKRDRSPGLRASHDRKMSPGGDREDRGRKESPRREPSYRHTSPLKEKRREYICKIEPYSLVEAERDYLSVCKRYSKLYVVPEFSKVWSHLHHASKFSHPHFEHEAVDIEDEGESSKKTPPIISDSAFSSASAVTLTPDEPALQTTIWNSKVMLMSGLTAEAFAEIVSEKSMEDKPTHLHNLLKFVALRKDRSAIMAAGGIWEQDLDGGNPATDDSALIRTAIRCTKESTQLDLSGCKSWIRVIEVHYNRVAEDGISSHKEITVMFLPNLSDSIPIMEVGQAQSREQQQAKLEHDIADKNEKVCEVNGVKDEKEVEASGEVDISKEANEEDKNSEKLEDKNDTVTTGASSKASKVDVEVEEVKPVPSIVLRTKCTKASKRKRSKFSDKPDVVEEKTEVELKIEEPAIKVEVKVEENGVEEKPFDQEDINKVVEGDMATAGDLEMKEVKIEKANGIEESEKSVKDADTEMSEAPATTEPAVKVEKVEERRVKKVLVVDQELLQAYRYFDKNRVGYLK